GPYASFAFAPARHAAVCRMPALHHSRVCFNAGCPDQLSFSLTRKRISIAEAKSRNASGSTFNCWLCHISNHSPAITSQPMKYNAAVTPSPSLAAPAARWNEALSLRAAHMRAAPTQHRAPAIASISTMHPNMVYTSAGLVMALHMAPGCLNVVCIPTAVLTASTPTSGIVTFPSTAKVSNRAVPATRMILIILIVVTPSPTHCQAVRFVGKPLHSGFHAVCRANGFRCAIAVEVDLIADCASFVGSRSIKILNSDFVLTLAPFDPKKCSLGSVPLAKPFVRCRIGLCNVGTRS